MSDPVAVVFVIVFIVVVFIVVSSSVDPDTHPMYTSKSHCLCCYSSSMTISQNGEEKLRGERRRRREPFSMTTIVMSTHKLHPLSICVINHSGAKRSWGTT